MSNSLPETTAVSAFFSFSLIRSFNKSIAKEEHNDRIREFLRQTRNQSLSRALLYAEKRFHGFIKEFYASLKTCSVRSDMFHASLRPYNFPFSRHTRGIHLKRLRMKFSIFHLIYRWLWQLGNSKKKKEWLAIKFTLSPPALLRRTTTVCIIIKIALFL